MNTLKIFTSASVMIASLFSSIGIVGAAGFAHAGGSAYVNSSDQTYARGHATGAYNNGTTSGSSHGSVSRGPNGRGYTYGSTSCTNGVSCTHYGQGASSNGGSYNTSAASTNNGDGTSTVNGTVNYVVPGTTTTQTKTGTRTISR